MGFNNLNISTRSQISILLKVKISARQIAKKINVAASTITREIKRCGGKENYDHDLAQQTSEELLKKRGRKTKLTEDIKAEIEKHIKLKWSPEIIIGRNYQGKLSFKTIYNWIDNELIDVMTKDLICKRKRKKGEERRGKTNIGISIHLRPKIIDNRGRNGDLEGDTVVAPRKAYQKLCCNLHLSPVT
ncbi:IS30 family transposase [[Mycoplasma] testudinis]|uniref:IS30 family transposase n=1 Tax=[Mycoplasma] testudinis TaxID=33924 RepID=UPI000AF53767|nr:IS30 family transposase [[Mycoplasma] testudinis]